MNGWNHRPTALYHLYDADDRLLYVGVTFNPGQRWTAHKREQFWWPLVVRKDLRWFADRAEALVAEIEAIAAGDPVYNTVHSPSLVKVGSTWTRYMAPLPPAQVERTTEERRAAIAATNAATDRLRTASNVVRKHDAERRELADAIVAARLAGVRPADINEIAPYDRNHVGRIIRAAREAENKAEG